MEIEAGMTLYRYTVKNSKLYIREGTVNHYGLRTCVNFKDGDRPVRSPRPDDIGIIRRVGHSLWLTERDDAKARKIFIDFEERRIAELQEQIDKKREIVGMLRKDSG